MTGINPLDGTGATTSAPSSSASSASSGALGQKDFLTLMTTQLKNQDPLKPMENGDFLAQMAQFSTVSGLERINDTLGSIKGSLRDARISMASNLLGHSVLVPGAVTRPDPQGAVRGSVELEDAADDLRVDFLDARTGQALHSERMGPQASGPVAFAWDGVPAPLVDARQPVQVRVTAQRGELSEEVPASVYARVLSASAGPGTDDLTLQIEDFGALNAVEIQSFR